jgi:phage-related protein
VHWGVTAARAIEPGHISSREMCGSVGGELPRVAGRLPAVAEEKPRHRRQWRDYRTDAGRRPVKEFLAGLPDEDAAAVLAAMRDVRENGLAAARHLKGDIYEVRADADRVIYRILFATEGRFSQILLALEGFKKKTQKTPATTIRLAEGRLAKWRSRTATVTRRPSARE